MPMRHGQQPPAHRLAPAAVINYFQAAQVQERFVDGLDLRTRRDAREQTCYTGADVAVKLEVGAEPDHPLFFEQLPVLEGRRPHGYAQGFGFGRPGHHTAVVAAQDHYRPAFQVRPEQPLAAYEEIIAVYEGEDGSHGRRS